MSKFGNDIKEQDEYNLESNNFTNKSELIDYNDKENNLNNSTIKEEINPSSISLLANNGPTEIKKLKIKELEYNDLKLTPTATSITKRSRFNSERDSNLNNYIQEIEKPRTTNYNNSYNLNFKNSSTIKENYQTKSNNNIKSKFENKYFSNNASNNLVYNTTGMFKSKFIKSGLKINNLEEDRKCSTQTFLSSINFNNSLTPTNNASKITLSFLEKNVKSNNYNESKFIVGSNSSYADLEKNIYTKINQISKAKNETRSLNKNSNNKSNIISKIDISSPLIINSNRNKNQYDITRLESNKNLKIKNLFKESNDKIGSSIKCSNNDFITFSNSNSNNFNLNPNSLSKYNEIKNFNEDKSRNQINNFFEKLSKFNSVSLNQNNKKYSILSKFNSFSNYKRNAENEKKDENLRSKEETIDTLYSFNTKNTNISKKDENFNSKISKDNFFNIISKNSKKWNNTSKQNNNILSSFENHRSRSKNLVDFDMLNLNSYQINLNNSKKNDNKRSLSLIERLNQMKNDIFSDNPETENKSKSRYDINSSGQKSLLTIFNNSTKNNIINSDENQKFKSKFKPPTYKPFKKEDNSQDNNISNQKISLLQKVESLKLKNNFEVDKIIFDPNTTKNKETKNLNDIKLVHKKNDSLRTNKNSINDKTMPIFAEESSLQNFYNSMAAIKNAKENRNEISKNKEKKTFYESTLISDKDKPVKLISTSNDEDDFFTKMNENLKERKKFCALNSNLNNFPVLNTSSSISKRINNEFIFKENRFTTPETTKSGSNFNSKKKKENYLISNNISSNILDLSSNKDEIVYNLTTSYNIYDNDSKTRNLDKNSIFRVNTINQNKFDSNSVRFLTQQTINNRLNDIKDISSNLSLKDIEQSLNNFKLKSSTSKNQNSKKINLDSANKTKINLILKSIGSESTLKSSVTRKNLKDLKSLK